MADEQGIGLWLVKADFVALPFGMPESLVHPSGFMTVVSSGARWRLAAPSFRSILCPCCRPVRHGGCAAGGNPAAAVA